MNRLSSVALLACLVLWGMTGIARAWQQTPAPSDPAYRTQVETQLQLERKLLALDLASFREARDRERGAQARVNEVSGRLDQALASETMALGNLEALHDELSAARETASNLPGRYRVIAFLVTARTVTPGAPADKDTLNRLWRGGAGDLPQDVRQIALPLSGRCEALVYEFFRATEDDPIVIVPEGYTVVDMDADPFTFDRSREPVIDLIEGEASELDDYTNLSYADGFQALIDQMREEYAFTEYKGLDWDALEAEYLPRFEQAPDVLSRATD